MPIAFSIYLVLGVIVAIGAYRKFDKDIEKKEKGETLSARREKTLSLFAWGIDMIGGLAYVLIFMSFVIVFWLPALIYGIIKKTY